MEIVKKLIDYLYITAISLVVIGIVVFWLIVQWDVIYIYGTPPKTIPRVGSVMNWNTKKGWK